MEEPPLIFIMLLYLSELDEIEEIMISLSGKGEEMAIFNWKYYVMRKTCFISQLFVSSSVFNYELSFSGCGGFVWRGEEGFDWFWCYFLVGWLVGFLVFFMCSICVLIMITASLRFSFPAYDSTRHIKI